MIPFVAFSIGRAWQGFWRNALMSLAATLTMVLMLLLLAGFFILQNVLLASLSFVEQKVRSALWLIKSVEQRQRTLRKVAHSLVKFQRDFLDKGLPHLRPLALRDVGEDIGMHESTISRVTTNKYVQTPQGLFELKYFFHSGIASTNGEVVSSVSVKRMIQDLVGAEDASKPLSDQDVAAALHGRGLTIARRTVAKYREELNILPSHQRRLAPRKR